MDSLRRRILLLALALAFAPVSVPAQTPSLRIGAAADLQPVLPKLLAAFERTTGIRSQASYASSATLATQILNGAPFDLFLAANRAFPQKIVDAHLALEPSPVTYASGSLVLWARRGVIATPLTLASLQSASIHRIAVANPVHAPYGAAAVAAIQSLGLTAALRPKLVYAENIAQAAQFAQSGNADCGLISKTIAITPLLQAAGHFTAVPQSAYPPIEQGAVVLRAAPHRAAAVRFLQFLASPAGAQLLAANGLTAPSHPTP